MSDKNEIQVRDVSEMDNTEISLYNPTALQILSKAGELVSRSNLIPAHYRNQADECAIAIYRAKILGFEPLAFMEQTYVVAGKLGIQGQLYIALINRSGIFKTPIQFEVIGDESDKSAMRCRAWVTRKDSDIVCESFVSYAMAVDNGWTKNPKWNTLTRLMLQYRAAAFLARVHCPEVVMGYRLVDELEDVAGAAAPVISGEDRGRQLFGSDADRKKPETDSASAEIVDAQVVEPEPQTVTEPPKETEPEIVPDPQPPEAGTAEATTIMLGDLTATPDAKRIVMLEQIVKVEGMPFVNFLVSLGWVSHNRKWESVEAAWGTVSDANIARAWRNIQAFIDTYKKPKA